MNNEKYKLVSFMIIGKLYFIIFSFFTFHLIHTVNEHYS